VNTAGGPSTRDRILDAALDVASRKGAEGTSMRALADACGINVAALYHHFPSKDDLLDAMIAERHYDLMMRVVEVPDPEAGTDRERLAQLMEMVWTGMRAEDRVWRMLLAEACHRNEAAAEVTRKLLGQFEEMAEQWLTANFTGLRVAPDVAAVMIADHLYGNIVRDAVGATTDDQYRRRADQLAELLTTD